MADEKAASSQAGNGFERAPLLRLRDALADFDRDASAAYEAKQTGRPRGPVTGFQNLDRNIGHALASGVHGIHGNAGAGKTNFALQICGTCQFPALFVSCEMTPGELLRRHTARVTKTYLGRFKSGELTPEAAHTLALRACEATPDMAILDATTAPATPDHIRDSARILLERADATKLLIVVDSLQSWAETLESDKTSEYETLNEAVRVLRQLAHLLDSPILFVSERNRDSMKSGGLNAGAGTRKIEYGAETVFDLDRDMEAQPNGAGEVDVMLRIAKNRHGAAGVGLPLKYNGALQTFRELDSLEAAERANQKAKTTKRNL